MFGHVSLTSKCGIYYCCDSPCVNWNFNFIELVVLYEPAAISLFYWHIKYLERE